MRSPDEALAWEKELERSGTTEFDGYCKRLARTAYGVASDGSEDAVESWGRTDYRGKGDPIRGALVWWTRPPAGHVVIADGKGNGIGNYWPADGKVRTLPLTEWNRVQGGKPAGWSRDIDGHLVVPEKPAQPSPLPVLPFLAINLTAAPSAVGRYVGPVGLVLRLCGVSANTRGAARIQRHLGHAATGRLTRDELTWLAKRFDLDTK